MTLLEFEDDSGTGGLAARAGADQLGTRFRLFPQPPFVAGYETPETVWIATPPSEMLPGPSDSRAYVVDPASPKEPYRYPFLPPFDGAILPPVASATDGHFDQIAVGTREFRSAHAFASVRLIVDMCEGYARQPIPWFFSRDRSRLEIVPWVPWDNAQSGYGFLELGERDGPTGQPFPLALNTDVVAHEVGHLALFGVLGVPQRGPSGDFLAFHEAAADCVSLITLLQFDTAIDRILRRTRGNLLVANELDRIAELSDETQIRVASHSLLITQVGNEVHDRSRPFTGAVFDLLVEIFNAILFERGLAEIDTRRITTVREDVGQAQIDRVMATPRAEFERKILPMREALQEARGLVGEMLLRSWYLLDPDRITFGTAAEAMIAVAEEGRARRFADFVVGNFEWRGIL